MNQDASFIKVKGRKRESCIFRIFDGQNELGILAANTVKHFFAKNLANPILEEIRKKAYSTFSSLFDLAQKKITSLYEPDRFQPV